MKLSVVRYGVLGVVLATLPSGVAMAQEAVYAAPAPAQVTTQETTSQATGPSIAMIGSGIAVFGLSYIPAVVVAGSSNLQADRTLWVPLAGPWMDLVQRPGCGAGASCNTENTNKVLLATDGVFQAVGVLTVIGGFLTPAHEVKTVQSTAKDAPAVHVSPASMGNGGYGMIATGTF